MEKSDQIIRSTLGDVIEVRERLAEVGTDVKHLAHDVKNLLLAMGNFVPRQEIMEMKQASLDRQAALTLRVETLEEERRWFARKLLTTSLGSGVAGAGIVSVVLKLVAH